MRSSRALVLLLLAGCARRADGAADAKGWDTVFVYRGGVEDTTLVR